MSALIACLSDKAIDNIVGGAFLIVLVIAAAYVGGAYFKADR